MFFFFLFLINSENIKMVALKEVADLLIKVSLCSISLQFTADQPKSKNIIIQVIAISGYFHRKP